MFEFELEMFQVSFHYRIFKIVCVNCFRRKEREAVLIQVWHPTLIKFNLILTVGVKFCEKYELLNCTNGAFGYIPYVFLSKQNYLSLLYGSQNCNPASVCLYVCLSVYLNCFWNDIDLVIKAPTE